jgi:hypothetical protein
MATDHKRNQVALLGRFPDSKKLKDGKTRTTGKAIAKGLDHFSNLFVLMSITQLQLSGEHRKVYIRVDERCPLPSSTQLVISILDHINWIWSWTK